MQKVCPTLKILFSLFIFYSSFAYSYDVLERYKLIEDKFDTEEMLRPIGHDFIIDIGAGLNKNVLELVDDAKNVDKGADTDAEKIQNASDVLQKWKNTEQTGRAKLNLGIPLPSFTAWGVRITPDLRAGAGFGANLGIRSEKFKLDDILEFVKGVPQEMLPCIQALTDSQLNAAGINRDIAAAVEANCTDPQIATLAGQYKGKYFMPELNIEVPNIHLMTKVDLDAGLLFNYEKGDHYFGYFKAYWLHRTDFLIRLTSEAIAKNTDILEGAKEKNSQAFIAVDYRFGYKNDNYSLFASIEELEIMRLTDKLDTAGDLNYKLSPLFRLHGEAIYPLLFFKLVPFAGLHYRDGYDFSSGLYAGLDWRAYVWKERLGIQVRGMIDTEYFTFSPRLKLWLMQLEFNVKTPVKSESDGVRISTLYSANFRLFF